jgi:hypothetical protein
VSNDRITIPQEVLDRIAPTALPRSSITISDEPLHKETNYRTEFVVALNNQPQGGLITRARSSDTRVARRNADDGFGLNRGGWNSQYDNKGRRDGQYYYQRQRGFW